MIKHMSKICSLNHIIINIRNKKIEICEKNSITNKAMHYTPNNCQTYDK